MKAEAYLRTFSEFFLDGAKIIFGSVVVGAFVPSAVGPVSWFTFIVGAAATMLFLVASAAINNLKALESI